MRITWILGVVVVTLSAQTPPAAPRGFGPPMASAELAERPQTRGAKGDRERHYYFEAAKQEMPYQLIVPQKYDGKTKMPLVVALHGYGGNQDYFSALVKNLPELCEQYGFIFVAPMGYTTGGWYGVVSKYRNPGFIASSRCPSIIIEHSAEAASATNRSGAVGETGLRENEQITEALMVSLEVIMGDELSNSDAQSTLSEQNHAFQAGLLNAAHEALGIAVQVRRSGWQLYGFRADLGQRGEELRREERIPVVNQVALALEEPVDGIGQIACDLAHPQAVGNRRDPGDLHAAGGKLDKKQHQEAPEALAGPDLYSEEIGGDDLFPVLSEKFLPGCFANSLR